MSTVEEQLKIVKPKFMPTTKLNEEHRTESQAPSVIDHIKKNIEPSNSSVIKDSLDKNLDYFAKRQEQDQKAREKAKEKSAKPKRAPYVPKGPKEKEPTVDYIYVNRNDEFGNPVLDQYRADGELIFKWTGEYWQEQRDKDIKHEV